MAVPGVAGVRGDLPGRDLEGGEQGGGSVALVVVGAALGQARAQRRHRGGAVQGLDLGLLVDRDHDRVVGRRQVEADDVADLGLQLRVGAELERLEPVRLDSPLAPDAGDSRERDAELGGQEPGRPVRDPQPPRRAPVIHQRRRDDLDLVDLRRPPGPPRVPQGRDPAGLIALAPGDHRRPGHARQPGDLRVRHPVGRQQDHPGPLRQAGRHARQPGQVSQLLAIALAQRQGRSKGHAPLSRQSNRKTTYDTRH